MEKSLVLFISLFCFTATLSLFAGKPVTVKSGNPAVLKQSSIALLEIDLSAAKVGAKPLKEHLKSVRDATLREISDAQALVENYFTARFNYLNKKKMQIVSNSKDVDYKIVVYVKELDMGNDAGAFIPHAPSTAGGVAISGIANIIDSRTGNVVCTLNIDTVRGGASPTIRLRMAIAFQTLAEHIIKLK
ncbi:MAG: hypothetical protein LBI45_04400 [Bacteroidales bacterium]|jgi:hypothetical protein|nr:hypothetical protein [Bacteroidales bacterium]